MDHSFWAAFGFLFGIENRRVRKEDKKQQEHLQERREGVMNATTKLIDTVSALVDAVGSIDLPEHLSEDLKLAPFLAMGEVLSAQGMVYEEQRRVLEIMLNNFHPMYNISQYLQAMIEKTGIFEEFMQEFALEKDRCGHFWYFIFEMIYRTRMIEKAQELDDNLSMIVASFSFLGDPNSQFPEAICNRLLEAINFHINEYQKDHRIRAIMLLQVILSEKMNIALTEQIAVQGKNVQFNGKNCFTFNVVYKDTLRPIGIFAVQEGADEDRIYQLDTMHNRYNIFYEEQV